jgi:hypothetical protein
MSINCCVCFLLDFFGSKVWVDVGLTVSRILLVLVVIDIWLPHFCFSEFISVLGSELVMGWVFVY